MKDKIMNNTGMKILSVFIAVIIWLLVANTTDPVVTKRFNGIKVQIKNEDKVTGRGYAYEVVSGDTVSVTVRGKNSIVSGLSAEDIEAVADFSNMSEVYAIQIQVDVKNKRYSDQLELSLGNVKAMVIKEEKTTSVSVPVNVEVNGEAAEGYAIGKTTGTPNLVKVTGPVHLLKNAREIRAEVNLDGEISEERTARVKPVLYDKDGEVISSSQIEMDTTDIDVKIEVWKSKSVKINLEYSGLPASGYNLVSFDYEPKSILIAAPRDELNAINSIDLDDISLDGLTDTNEWNLNIADQLSQNNVKLVDETTDVKAKATIEKIISRTVSFSEKDITVKGNSGGKVTFDSNNKYSMTVEGTSSLIQSLKIGDFDPWINVEGLEEGRHELTVHVKEIEGAAVEQTARITVTLGE
ncbi:MAG: hypothetical protein IJ137_02510 [Eubacterium sp.]|nr:hypothetical protein [Eubacterium sp.]